MGQAQSTVGTDAAEDVPRIEPGVRVTKELLEQLSGQPRRRPSGPPAFLQPLRSHQLHDAAQVVLQRDAQLQHAFRQSRRIGDQLLKDEAEEMCKIDRLAEDLLKREQRAPAKEPPCLQERADCLQCYKAHPEDALHCADYVKAYSACAQKAIACVSR